MIARKLKLTFISHQMRYAPADAVSMGRGLRGRILILTGIMVLSMQERFSEAVDIQNRVLSEVWLVVWDERTK
jgi:hypothetical protein